MHRRLTILHRPLFGAIEQLVSDTGTLFQRLGTASTRLAAASQALSAELRQEAEGLSHNINLALRRNGGPNLTEAVGLARQMVDLYDRHAIPPELPREILFRRAWQRLYAAALILCSDTGTIQERLSNVYLSAFMYWPANEMPPACEEDFLALKEELARIVQFRTLGAERARFLAHEIFLLYAEALGMEYERAITQLSAARVEPLPPFDARTPRLEPALLDQLG